jgi:hypothetical protein
MCQCVRVPSVRVRAVIVCTRDQSRCEPKRDLIIVIGSIRSLLYDCYIPLDLDLLNDPMVIE